MAKYITNYRYLYKLLTAIMSLFLIIFVPVVVMSLVNAKKTDAVWYDDTFAYRQKISFTHNADITSERAITLTLDTAELIGDGVMQADCDDTRFTDINGKVLRYKLTGTCNNAATTYSFVMPQIYNATNIAYVYYGNSSAISGSTDLIGTTELTPSGGAPSITTRTNESKSPGPISYWKFDEGTDNTCSGGTNDVCDSVGRSATNGAISGATWQTEDQCVTGKCLDFDGSNDYISVASNSVFNISSDITLSAWIKRNSTTHYDPIIAKTNGTSEWDYDFNIDDNGILAVYSDAMGGGTADSTKTISDTSWHHVAVTRTGDLYTFYIDGANAGSETVAGNFATNSYPVQIGADGTGVDGSNFKGKIDEVRVYNYTKSAAQMMADYVAGKARQAAPKGAAAALGANDQSNPDVLSSGLLGYWTFNETSGTASDASGNGLTLTNNSSVSYTSGKFGNSVRFNASNYMSSGTTISGIRTISFWILPTATTDNLVNLAPGKYITVSSGTITATGFTSPTIYVNGVVNGTVALSSFYFVTITDTSTISASAFEIGRANGSFCTDKMQIDNFRFYSRMLTPVEINQLYNWAPGPVGYWNLNENQGSTAIDTSSNSNYSASNITRGVGGYMTGKVGSGYNFDGADTVINAGSGTTLDDMPQVTLEAWIYPRSMGEGSAGVIMAKNVGTSPSAGWLLQLSGTNALTFTVDGSTDAVRTTSSSVVTLNTWNHVAVSWNGGFTAFIPKILVNGVENATYATSTNGVARVSDATSTLFIGNDSTSARTFDGIIDDVRVYNYARSSKQMIEDLNAGDPAGGQSAGSQIAYWKFDEQQGQTTNNSAQTSLTSVLGTTSGSEASDPTWKTAGSSTCKINGCLDFDGSNDVVTVTNATAIDINDTLANSFTISAWIYADGAGEGTGGQIFSKANSYLRVDTLSGGRVDLEAVLDTAGTDPSVNVSSALATGTWNHVAMTWNSVTFTITLYVNGQAVGTGVGTNASTQAENGTLNIGGSTTNNFDGRIDEFKVYSYLMVPADLLVDMNANSSVSLGGVVGTQDNEGFGGNPPVAWWKMEEGSGISANDSSGNANTGTLTNSPVWSTGKIGKALSFNGTNSYVSVTSSTTLNITGDMTIEAWANPSALDSAFHEIVFKGTTTDNTTRQYGLRLTTNNRWEAVLYIGSTAYSIGNSAATAATANSWVHLALVRTGSTGYLYMNGVLVATTTSISGTLNTGANILAIGRIGAVNAEYFSGLIDDVRMYDYARSPAQIAYDYNRGAPIAWYKFDQCQGTTLYDWSGNSYNGTITPGAGTNTAAGSCNSGTSSEMWNNGTTGKFNSSLDFDGSDDYVTVADPSSGGLDFVDGQDFSISAWIYANSFTAAKTFIAKKTGNTSGAVGYMLLVTAGQKLNAFVSDGTDQFFRPSNNTLVANTWYHVVFVFDEDSSTNSKFYVNGIDDNGTATGTITDVNSVANSQPFVMGAESDFGGPFDGQLDEVSVYNYALSAAQVRNLYRGGAVYFGPATGAP